MAHNQQEKIASSLSGVTRSSDNSKTSIIFRAASATAQRVSYFTWSQLRLYVLLIVFISIQASSAQAQWLQWGGRDRNFSVEANGLADKWPDAGPKQLWERPLGDGYTTILADDGLLYTMYRDDVDEFVIALDAKSGKTVWQHKIESPLTDDRKTYGPGPYATPLIVGDRLFSVSTNSFLHCFNKKTGQVIWQHDLIEEYDALIQGFGFSSSPIAYKNTIIIPVGRKVADDSKDVADSKKADSDKDEPQAQSMMAFDQQSGSLAWENLSYGVTKFNSTYSSPILINFAGQDQLVLFMATELAGLDPSNGQRLWGVPHATKYDENVSTPVWDGQNMLFCSSAYGSGSRAIKLKSENGKTVPSELWHTKKMRVLHGNVVNLGGYVYGSSGDFGPAFFTGINIATGELTWRKRGFKKATCLRVGSKVIILDEDGQLALTSASPGDLTIHSRCQLKLHSAWATPTLVGKILYIRDRERILALDLG